MSKIELKNLHVGSIFLKGRKAVEEKEEKNQGVKARRKGRDRREK